MTTSEQYRPPQPTAAGLTPPAMPPLGGLGARLAARVVDWVIVLVPGLAIATAVVLGSGLDDRYLVPVANVAAALLGFGYEALMLARAGGRTLGKRLLGLRVVLRADAAAPVGAPAWIRAAVYWLPGGLGGFLLPLLFSLLDVLWCTWDKPYRQCLHDKAARTVVVKAG